MENSKEPEKKKVSEKELENVTGGCGRSLHPHNNRNTITRMVCHSCDYVIWYNGNWYRDGKYKCPNCGKIELEGVKTKSQKWR